MLQVLDSRVERVRDCQMMERYEQGDLAENLARAWCEFHRLTYLQHRVVGRVLIVDAEDERAPVTFSIKTEVG